MPPVCRATSAISGFTTTMVVTRAGSLTSLSWATLTSITSAEGPSVTATGHNRTAIANAWRPKSARARIRFELTDILYPGALTTRQKRYAAEPAPDWGKSDDN